MKSTVLTIRNRHSIMLIISIMLICTTGTAFADVIRWHFSATTFYDGTSLTGYFDYDTDSRTIVTRNIITQEGDLSLYTYNDLNNGGTWQHVDSDNVFAFESLLHFQVPRVDVNGDGSTLVDRWIDVINWDSTDINLNLSDPIEYELQPLDGNFGYENVRTWHFTSTGEYDYSDAPRYINAVTLTPEIITSDTDGDGLPDNMDSCPNEDSTGLDANNDGCIDTLGDITSTLATLVDSEAIDTTMASSLLSKINNAISSASLNSICAAVNQLQAFKTQIAAQRGKKVSSDAADLLTQYADNVIASLQSNLSPGDSCL